MPTKLWISALSKLTPEQIKLGLDACIARGRLGAKFPPNLPHFVAMCTPMRANEAMYRDTRTPLLEKKLTAADRINGRSHIAALKSRLKDE